MPKNRLANNNTGTMSMPSQYIALRKNSVFIQNKLQETPTHKKVHTITNQWVINAKFSLLFSVVFLPKKKGSAEYLNAWMAGAFESARYVVNEVNNRLSEKRQEYQKVKE